MGVVFRQGGPTRDVGMTDEDRERIKEGLRREYSKVAAGPEESFRYPVGRAGLQGPRDTNIWG